MSAPVSARRELTAAVLLCALAGALALSSSSQPWARVTVTRQPPLPPTSEVLSGGEAAPLVAACGLLLLAAAVAVIALRGAGRVALGLLVAAAGGALGWSGLRGVTGDLDLDLSADVGLSRAAVTTEPVSGWAALALVAGVLGVLAGLLVVLRGRAWPGMGRRYERTGAAPTASGTAAPTTADPSGGDPSAATSGNPARSAARPARAETDEDRHQAAWKALDRGDDPTV